MSEIIMTNGLPASGKSTYVQKYLDTGYVWLNRDSLGGKIKDLLPKMREVISQGKNVILDNTHLNPSLRQPFLDLAWELGSKIHAKNFLPEMPVLYFNAANRIYQNHKKSLSPEEIKSSKDSHVFSPSLLREMRKKYQPATLQEGFETVEYVTTKTHIDTTYTNKALILDYDQTLRKTKTGGHYPIEIEDIEILSHRQDILKFYQDKGYYLLGVSNQSGIASGKLTLEKAIACFEETNRLLDVKIDYLFCPHAFNPGIPACWCRKPMPLHGIMLIEKYKLDAKQCLFVGDAETDQEFAVNCGFQYMDQAEFFGDYWVRIPV